MIAKPYTSLRITAALAVAISAWGASMPDARAAEVPLPRAKPEVGAGAQAGYPQPRDKPPSPIKRGAVGDKPGSTLKADGGAAERGDDTPASAGWNASQVEKAKAACAKLLKGLSVTYEPLKPVGKSKGCGIAAPIKVSSIGKAHPVQIKPAATLNCKLTAALVKWVDRHLQPQAKAAFKEPVKRIRNASSYVCRRRNNSPNGKLSEHALGNALDISSFTFKSGKTVTVKAGWRRQGNGTVADGIAKAIISPATPGSKFLRGAHKGACKEFSTILGPDANASHHDHFHFDLGRGGRYLICD